MVPYIALEQFASDCLVLLQRALLSKTLSCFGADGNGQYGRHLFAKHFQVADIDVTVNADSDDDLFGTAKIALLGYNSADCGHVATDMNLKIAVNNALQSEYIHTDCWSWAPLEDQGSCYFTINFSPNKLLSGEP
jgi:hypothetical protein